MSPPGQANFPLPELPDLPFLSAFPDFVFHFATLVRLCVSLRSFSLRNHQIIALSLSLSEHGSELAHALIRAKAEFGAGGFTVVARVFWWRNEPLGIQRFFS